MYSEREVRGSCEDSHMVHIKPSTIFLNLIKKSLSSETHLDLIDILSFPDGVSIYKSSVAIIADLTSRRLPRILTASVERGLFASGRRYRPFRVLTGAH